MGKAIGDEFSISHPEAAPAGSSFPPQRSSVSWTIPAAVLTIVVAAFFMFGDSIIGNLAESDLVYALPVLWLMGLIWKAVGRGG